MKKYKLFIILGIALVYLVIALFVLKDDLLKNDNNKIYFVLNNSVNYEYYNKKFKKVTDGEITSLNKKFTVYNNSIEIGNYTLKKIKVWNLFDEDDNYVSYDGDLFAVSNASRIQIDTLASRKMNKEEKKALKKEYKFINFDNLYTENVYDIDLNSDGEDDKIICLSNYSNEKIDKYYNLVVAIIGNKFYNIVSEKKNDVNGIYLITSVFSVDKLENKYFILKQINHPDGDISSYSENSYIYGFKKNDYVRY